jgi:maltose/moltooligosaccharide transporter
MFIVIPMIIQMLTLPLLYNAVLDGDPRNVLRLAGIFLIIAAGLTLRIRSASTNASITAATAKTAT